MMNQKNIYVKIMQHMENIEIQNVQKLVKTDEEGYTGLECKTNVQK